MTICPECGTWHAWHSCCGEVRDKQIEKLEALNAEQSDQISKQIADLKKRTEAAEAELAESDKVLSGTAWTVRCILSEYEHKIDELMEDMIMASIIFKAEELHAIILQKRTETAEAERDKLREAGQGIRTYWYRYIADGDKRMQYGAWLQYMKSAIRKLEAALGEGGGG